REAPPTSVSERQRQATDIAPIVPTIRERLAVSDMTCPPLARHYVGVFFEAGFDLVAGGDGGGAVAFDGEGGGAGGEADGFPDVATFPEADEQGGGEDVAGAGGVDDVGGKGVDVAPVTAHADVGAVVTTGKGDELDEV